MPFIEHDHNPTFMNNFPLPHVAHWVLSLYREGIRIWPNLQLLAYFFSATRHVLDLFLKGSGYWGAKNWPTNPIHTGFSFLIFRKPGDRNKTNYLKTWLSTLWCAIIHPTTFPDFHSVHWCNWWVTPCRLNSINAIGVTKVECQMSNVECQ